MISQKKKIKIEYECNLCRKTRILYIDPSLHEKVDSKGYMEYVDLHACVGDKLQAVILYVDKSLTVRSQVPVKVGSDVTPSQIGTFNIPSPHKVELLTKEITKPKKFKGKNLKRLEITDRLRQTKFLLDGPMEGEPINVTSEFHYIDIRAHVSKSVSVISTMEWFQKLSSILEAIILLDEEMLSYLVLYLDPKLPQLPTTNGILDLDLLLHAKSAYPHSNLKTYAILKRQWHDLRETLEHNDYRLYEKPITYCIGNQYKTLLDIYQQKLEKEMDFVDYIGVINELAMLGLVNIEKVQFITVNE